MTLRDLQVLEPLLVKIVTGLERELPYASALCQQRAGTSVRVTAKQTAVEPQEPMLGCVLSAFTGYAFVEVSTHDLSAGGLQAAAAALLARAQQSGVDAGASKPEPGEPLRQAWTTPEVMPSAAVSLEDKVARAQEMRAKVAALDARINHSVARIATVQTQELFINRTRVLFQDLRRGEAVAMLVMQHGDHQAEMYGGRGRAGGFEHCALDDTLLQDLVLDCAAVLGAPRVDAGTHECVFSPDFSGLFAHEAFGHGTEADMFLKRRARGAEYLGKRVASSLVDMFDSPALPGHAATYHFDHEGQLASETQIIKNGILINPLTNLDAALRLGLPRTANGRRESFERKTYTRMTNTYFGAGSSTVDEVFAGVKRGLFIKRGSNGMEDPKGWGIQCEGSMAQEIVDGRLTSKVFTPVIVTGYVPDLLQSITAVSNAVEINGLGMCGKGHKEWVKVTDGGPYLRLHARVA